jgi:hypothetical protein
VPWLLKAMGMVSDPQVRDAAALLRSWHRTGAHRRDLNKDGTYDDDAAVTLMDAWWPKLVEAQFGRVLAGETIAKLRDVVPYDAELGPGKSPSAPAFSTGWYGYVHKDLRQLLRPKRVRGKFSRVYCGAGKRKRCAADLRRSLREALSTTKQELYGKGECADNAQAACFDMNRYTVASAISVPDMVFQNRPTFQQTVELTRKLPR